MRFSDTVKKTLIALFYILFTALVFKTCPFYAVFHIPCPACGMTRAYVALLSGNWNAAWTHHPLFWLVPVLWLGICLDPEYLSPAWRKIRQAVLIFIALPFFLRWILLLLQR